MVVEPLTSDYCEVCFSHQHRKGTRQKHTVKKIKQSSSAGGLVASIQRVFVQKDDKDITAVEFVSQSNSVLPSESTDVSERAKFIPLRLTYDERKYLRLLEACLNVCEYTDKIDVISYTSKNKRIVMQIKEICAILSGLVLAADYKGR